MGDVFGDASDGDVTLSANTVLSRDMYYGNLTLAGGVALNPNGFRVFVHDTLTLGAGASIGRDGGTGTATAASVMSPGTLGIGAPGESSSAACSQAATNITNSLGGNGGNASSTTGGLATPPTAAVGGPQIFNSVTSAILGRTLDGAVVNGGAGGGLCQPPVGAPTPGQGGGGGVVVIVARTIALTGASASFTANGGAGSGGFGGGGGVIVVVSTGPQPTGLALSVAPGASPSAGVNATSGNTYWLD